MAILSIDLSWRRWTDLGIVILSRAMDGSSPIVDCEIVPFGPPGLEDDPKAERGPVNANNLAGRLNHLCGVRGIRVILLDGPQAWKSKQNGLVHQRLSERELNTPAKTGLPGLIKPLSYRAFSEFCVDVYDALAWRGWRRLTSLDDVSASQERILVETSPQAAWKSLGLKPLKAKRRTAVSDLAEAYAALKRMYAIRTSRPPNHDQLQAIVAGLAGLALEARDIEGMRLAGQPPRREDGEWREGYIALPLPPIPKSPWFESLRWLD